MRQNQRQAPATLLCSRLSARFNIELVVLACDAASVNALDALRDRFPGIPFVMRTVPAIKPAIEASVKWSDQCAGCGAYCATGQILIILKRWAILPGSLKRFQLWGIELTRQERETLRLFASEKKIREIAKELFLTSKTVQNHRSNIYVKINGNTTIEMIAYGLRKEYWILTRQDGGIVFMLLRTKNRTQENLNGIQLLNYWGLRENKEGSVTKLSGVELIGTNSFSLEVKKVKIPGRHLVAPTPTENLLSTRPGTR